MNEDASLIPFNTPGRTPTGRLGTAGTAMFVGGDISAYRIDMRFLILSSTHVDFRAAGFAGRADLFTPGPCPLGRASEGLRVRRDCMLIMSRNASYGPVRVEEAVCTKFQLSSESPLSR